MADGGLTLGTQANTTIENGLETACWYRQEGLQGPLLLITGRDHMPRASIALEASLPGVTIRRLPLDPDGRQGFGGMAEEFAKFVATRLWQISRLVGPGNPECVK